jgi:hypothetical protein
MLGVALMLALFFLFGRNLMGWEYRCDRPAASLTDMSSINDLRTRFNDDEGSPRLVLLLAPT